ncbi:MAG TPA: PilC/PilY family type IV pilus protein [Rubrivivax sp.]|nr:PilC/PilY family type IV pilus protein [Rubrivivax sp.]
MKFEHSTSWARSALRCLAAAAALCGSSAAFAQTIDDVPMAVKNNTPPNFMFMLDDSGSMNNIVPTAPYNDSVDYTPSGCSNVLAKGTSVRLVLSGGGAPRIRVGSNDYKHWSLATSGNDRRCFKRTDVYDGYLITGTVYLGSDYTGNYLNWYFGNADGHPVTGWSDRKLVNTGSVQTRMEIARDSATSVISGLPVNNSVPVVRVGLSTYNGSDGGKLRVAIGDLTTSKLNTLKTTIAGLQGTGNTPLAETLADIGRYMATGYSGNITADWVSGVLIKDFLMQDGRQSCLNGANCSTSTTDSVPANPATGTPTRPIQYWCQRSYAFLLTDGRPQQDQAFTQNTYLRDYDRDCQGALASTCVSNGAAGAWDRKNARGYESAGSDYLDDIAKALYDVDLRPNLPSPDPINRPKKNNLLTYTIGFADLQVQNDPLLINTAKQGGGKFLSAQDGPSLTNAFGDVVTDAFSKDAAAAAVAVANAQITLNNVGFASSYKSGAWYGDLAAYSLDTTTALQTGGDIWSLRSNLDAMAPGSRNIATYNGSSGVAFAAGLAYGGKPATLTDPVINYLRGDRSGEGTTYRQRQSVLGDIINAEPVVVTYGSVPIIFQGANDGMLHVVDGRTDASATTRGQELWAYVPKLLHGNLHELADPSYAHRYFIDGTPATADVTGVGSVNKLLVGGLGKGGRGYYALDISSYTAATDADAASKVLWEFSPPGMGYSFGTPLVVNTAAGWRVLVTSGYQATVSGRVWVLDPATGNVLATLDTGAGASGLAHLGKLGNAPPNDIVRYVWGGDLLGNVWRFDLDTGTVVKIASLTDDGGSLNQPVTSAPEVSLVSGSTTKFVVMFGTGRYLADEDVPGVGQNTWAAQRQTIYGLFDDTTVANPTLPNLRGSNGNSCPSGGGNGDLVCQSLALTTNAYNGQPTYAATTHAVNPASRRGWYIDLPLDANLTHGRIVSKPSLTTGGTLALTVNIPTNVQCDPGGRSWYLAIAGATGGAVAKNVGGNTYFDAGYFLGYALASRTVVVTTANGKRALIRMSDKTVQAPPVYEPATSAAQWRRVYWRSVKN